MLPDTPRDRLRWALSESLIVAGIFLAWLAIAIGATIALQILTFPIRFLLGYSALSPDGLLSVSVLGNAVLAIGLVTSLLYVAIRAGTMLIDYSRDSSEDRS